MSNILDGKKVSNLIKEEVAKQAQALKAQNITPTLAVILIGDDPASHTYVNAKSNACNKASIASMVYKFPQEVKEEIILDEIKKLNENKNIHGILVQLPLPKHISEQKVISTIDYKKDVDGFHPYNIGKLSVGLDGFIPATPYGVLKLLEHYNISLEGKKCVVVGASNIVGKPLAIILSNKNATVSVCNIFTKNLKEECLQADLLFSATGVIKLIKKDMIKDGCVVVDIGINKDENGKLVGDVDFENLKDKCSYITPVPGGVGPMTIAMLLSNTIKSAQNTK